MAIMSKDLEREAIRLRAMITPELLTELIIEYHIFDTIDAGDADALALRNFGLGLLARMGMIQDITLPELVDKWMKIDYTYKEQNTWQTPTDRPPRAILPLETPTNSLALVTDKQGTP